jgi:transcriptional regulator of aroF, aroG, tyrA and aromatic amino acid transport
MLPNIKLKLQVVDRVGAMAEITSVLAKLDLNIISMEVEKSTGDTFVFLDLEARQWTPDQDQVIMALQELPNTLRARVIRTMPQERRERRFQVVLDSISDGIIAIDEEGELRVINRVARQMLNIQQHESIGKDLRELKLPDHSLLTCLLGKTYTNSKRNLISGNERYQYLASGKIIRDAQERIVGALEVMQDMKGIRELANAVAGTEQLHFSDMIGRSPAIHDAITFAEKIAATDGIVSIRGESGTGKELFASAIHADSGRSGPFVPVNCAALPENLLESELFGYVGGAFSGAKKDGKPGLFETARNGTIFLDEITEMPFPLQAKMLRVIQEGKIRRIGGNQEIAVDTRIITATNKNLEQLVEEGKFREDLYYRINVFPIHIPPLRERLEDIPLLVEHFLFQVSNRLGKSPQQLTDAALQKLKSHRWPGNVREFRNVIERSAILGGVDTIDVDSILFSFELGQQPDALSRPPQTISDEPLARQVELLERRIVAQALKKSKSKRQAAILLGISHTALLKKLKKYGDVHSSEEG